MLSTINEGSSILKKMSLEDGTEMGGENAHLKRTHDEAEEPSEFAGLVPFVPVNDGPSQNLQQLQEQIQQLPPEVQNHILAQPRENQIQAFYAYLNSVFDKLTPTEQEYVNSFPAERRFDAMKETVQAKERGVSDGPLPDPAPSGDY
ncbi:hypothetical protein SEMRO_1984_G309360.1 [Seminavis robusta]|uniref:Uncharacterized protein n=1 Tax=Seminavis robusta TaxID=568900 RepID=A0A9N8HVH0_9STRA|nr:hypothetical protein SEMRO_1984_G309360.1 [Seminavis robusta]|eukprot:Sro1984_g309360.1 n/a (147) ;mRNA; f:11525-11965